MEFIEQVNLNRIIPSEIYSTTNPEKAIKLRSGGLEDFRPITIPQIFKDLTLKYEDRIAMVSKPDRNGKSQNITYKQYYSKMQHTAKVFIQLGLQTRNAVGILAFNCPEWFYSKMATIHAGGIFAGIYPSNSPEAVLHILKDSRANIVVVDDSKQMQKIRQIRDKLPLLRAVIQIEGPFEDFIEDAEGYYKWSDIEAMNVHSENEELNKRLLSIAVNECCCLIYTSGTVGLPKGVMLSHDNILFTVRSDFDRLPNMRIGRQRIVSYLPLSHIAAVMIDGYLSMLCGGTVYFTDRNVLKGSLINAFQRVRPTCVGGVPRIYEKIEEAIKSAESKTNIFQKTVMNWGRNTILQHHLKSLQGCTSESLQYKIAKNLVAMKVKRALGLDAVTTIFTAAAPTPTELKKFFFSIDFPLLEVYGLSESSGAHNVSSINSQNWQTVGKTILHSETKIVNKDENGHGEICFRGRDVFMGYIGDEEKTKEVVDEDGWLHTGDIGHLDNDHNLYVTGRLKELIITSGGENIPPVVIENVVKEQLPQLLSNAFLVGDKRKYLTILITLKTQIDPETGEISDSLEHDTVEFLKKEIGLEYTNLSDILNAGPCAKVLNIIQKGIDRANLKAISNAQRIQKFAILPQDFSLNTGELGPTFKVKRNVVYQKYESIINALYK